MRAFVIFFPKFISQKPATSKLAGFMLSTEKQFYEKLSKKELSSQEVFEAKSNLVGFFDLLYQIDKKKKDDKSSSSAGST